MHASSVEREFFRMLNRVIEPRVRAGWGSPRFVPGGVIVLETKGRRTGRRHRTPLAAIRVQGHTLVSTFRAHRSDWVKNAAANADVRYWVGGRPRPARAFILAPDGGSCRAAGLPAAIRWLVPLLVPYTHAGWAFAVLSPERSARTANGTGLRNRRSAQVASAAHTRSARPARALGPAKRSRTSPPGQRGKRKEKGR